jgi:hypothetical protein
VLIDDDPDEQGEQGEEEDEDVERIVLICDLCVAEFTMVNDDAGVSIPIRPWYCYSCAKRLRKSRKRRQTPSKQMLLELAHYGKLLRPTAAKRIDRLQRALRGRVPRPTR